MVRVTVLELSASYGDPRAALARVAAELEGGPETDLVLLPEASLTGYVSPDGDFDLTRFAETIDGPTARAVAELARSRRIVVVAPLVLREGRHVYNAMLAYGRDGRPIFTYRKRHPWLPETWASEGTEAPLLVDIEGVKVTIATCYDVHFLEEDAADVLDAADLLLFPTAWVERDDSRPVILPELARRHRVAIANANWGPGVVRIAGQGSSCILDAAGRPLCGVTPGTERIRADAALELAALRHDAG